MGFLELLGFKRAAGAAPAPPAPAALSRVDGFTVPAGSPLAAAHGMVDAVLAEAVATGRHHPLVEPKETESGRRILALSPEEQVPVAIAAMERAMWVFENRTVRNAHWWVGEVAAALVRALLRRRLPFVPAELATMLDHAARTTFSSSFSLKLLLTQVGHACADPAAHPVLHPPLQRLGAKLKGRYGADNRDLAARVAELLGGGVALTLEPEPWTGRIVADLAEMDENGGAGRDGGAHLRDGRARRSPRGDRRLDGRGARGGDRRRGDRLGARRREAAEEPARRAEGGARRGAEGAEEDGGGDGDDARRPARTASRRCRWRGAWCRWTPGASATWTTRCWPRWRAG